MIVGMPNTRCCTIEANQDDDGSILVSITAEGVTLAPAVFPKQRYCKQRAREYVDLLATMAKRFHHVEEVTINTNCL